MVGHSKKKQKKKTHLHVKLILNHFQFPGTVDLEELILAFKELGFQVDKAEASRLLDR